MSFSNKKLIAVIGATGQQGSGVVRALQASSQFKVRAHTRSPEKHRELADEVVEADLNRPETVKAAFEEAHGVFLVTNFRPKACQTRMLHEVAAGDLFPGDIINPLRRILRHVKVVEADVCTVDLTRRIVGCRGGIAEWELTFEFDHLLLTLGSKQTSSTWMASATGR
jgi:glutamyl-tRNA reductase